MEYGIYQHYKGKFYRVFLLGRDADTLEETVMYYGLSYDEKFGLNPLWTRKKTEFEKALEDGRTRYTYIGPFPEALESIKDKL